MTMPLEWFVFIERNGKVESFNIFYHWRLWEDLVKLRKKHGKRNATEEDRKVFEEQVSRNLQYYYWSKCEWEIVITSFPYHIKDGELRVGCKIDVYEQVMANWKRFINYLWENRMKLKPLKDGG